MKNSFAVVAAFVCILLTSGFAHADLEDFISDLNVRASVDMSGFNARLSNQFGVPLADVRIFTNRVFEPADAFMCFQLGQMTHQNPYRVYEIYQKNRGQGWGAIAKELGIKPGSAEFHALKNGNFSLTGKYTGSPSKGKGKGKGNSKGKGTKGKEKKNN